MRIRGITRRLNELISAREALMEQERYIKQQLAEAVCPFKVDDVLKVILNQYDGEWDEASVLLDTGDEVTVMGISFSTIGKKGTEHTVDLEIQTNDEDCCDDCIQEKTRKQLLKMFRKVP